MKKIFRRILQLLRSLPNITYDLLFEYDKHPWNIVRDYLILSSQNFITKSSTHLSKYFRLFQLPNGNNGLYLTDSLIFVIPKNRIGDEHYLYTLLVLYFDIIYTNTTKRPIPVLLQEGSYESTNMQIESGDTVLDIGANIGVFTIYAAQKTGQDGRVYSFEPIPELASQIADSVQANEFTNVQIIESAVSDTAGKTELLYSSEDFGGASLSLNYGEKVTVPLISIDDFFEKNLIDKIDFIKMDIEGMEPNAIRGAKKVISEFKPKLAICTYHDSSHPELLERLILEYNPSYKIHHTSHKIFAW